MIGIRERLESHGHRPCCFGAAENVYPSGMCLEMGTGDRAFRLCMGRPAKMSDLVAIFESEPVLRPVTVETQKTYYERWLAGLGD
ncbi:MAG: hypothetical protein QM811_22405 [Pirellulales bacterium]